MATNTIHVDVPAADVFAVLADGWRYSNWVVGTSHMYAVQSEWPAVGSKLFHASGAWPLVVRDHTEVVGMDEGRRLELIAHGGAMGDARIVLELDDDTADGAGGCTVTMHEAPVAGPGKLLHNPLGEAVLHRRNTEALNRLKSLAERRTEPRR